MLDANLGGHMAAAGDVSGSGLVDFIAKPWRASARNALGGKMFIVYLSNESVS